MTEIRWDEIPNQSGVITLINDKGEEKKVTYDQRTKRLTIIRNVGLHIPTVYIFYDKDKAPEKIKSFIYD